MRKTLTISTLLLLLTLVSFSVLPSGIPLKQAKAQGRPSTIITAFDGKGAVIPNGGTTTSNTIMFRFETMGGVPPFTYTCLLKGGVPFSCNNPAFSTLPPGMYLFSVTPTDSTGDTGIPSLFSWTVVSTQPPPPSNPIQAIQQLIQLKQNMHLSRAADVPLDAELNAALITLPHSTPGACTILNGFSLQVHAFQRAGLLTQTQASELLQGVQSVENVVGCR